MQAQTVFGVVAVITLVAFVVIPLGFGTKSGTRYARTEKRDSWWNEAALSLSLLNPLNAVRDWWDGYADLGDVFIRFMGALMFVGVASSVVISLWAIFH